MKNLIRALVAAFLGINLIWVISMAQNMPPNPGQSEKPQRPEGRQEIGRGPEGPNPRGPGDMMDNPNVQAEMKRHWEAMKGFAYEIKALHDKIRKELESKIGETENGRKSGPDMPGSPGKDDRPQPPDRGDRPKPPDKSGNPEEPNRPKGPVPPDQQGNPPENSGPEGKLKEDQAKILEPYHAEAEQIADRIYSELITHHQNLLKIVTAEKETMKKTITEKILMPPKRPEGPGMNQRPEPPDRPDRPDRPNKDGRPDPSDRGDRPEPPDRPDGSDEPGR